MVLSAAAEGAQVVFCGRDADAAATVVERGGPGVSFVAADLTDEAAIEHLFDAAAERMERLDAVVNNAGVAVDGPIEALDLDDVRRQLEINVVAQIAVTQVVLPLLRASRGRVVFVSSLSGRISTPMTGIYNASKFALEAVADALRVELRPWRIPVVLVEPGPTATDMWGGALQQHEAMVAGLSAEHRALYAKHIEGTKGLIAQMQKRAVPVEKVASVVEKAVTARRPRARYPVGFGGRAQAMSAALTPTPVLDAVFARVSGAR